MLFDYSKADKMAASFPKADFSMINALRSSSARKYLKTRRFIIKSGLLAGASLFLWLPILRPYSYFQKYPTVQKHSFLPDFAHERVVSSVSTVANKP